MKKELKFFKKIELVISHPHKFFEDIKNDKDIWDVFRFYFVFVLLSIIINTLFLLPSFIKDKLNLSLVSFIAIVLIMILFVLLIILATAFSSFVLFWFYHILIKIFRGKNMYKETYKLLYCITPMLIVTLIPMYGAFKIIFYPLFVLASLDALYIEYIGLQKLQKLSKENAIAVLLISAVISIMLIKYLIDMKLISL